MTTRPDNVPGMAARRVVPTSLRRRLLLQGGGLCALAALAGQRLALAADAIDIDMAGTANGAEVWFRPRGLLVPLGQTVRWVNRDTGNVHTATAYHPDNGKPLRIPHGALAWDSDYLMPGQSFSYTFRVPGVYDYFCKPHEHAGMVGRIVVQAPDSGARALRNANDAQLPRAARDAFVDVARILEEGRVD